MEYLVGITLALFFCAAAAGLGMDRERAFYPAVLIAVAQRLRAGNRAERIVRAGDHFRRER